jgi:hypothetical protein
MLWVPKTMSTWDALSASRFPSCWARHPPTATSLPFRADFHRRNSPSALWIF